MVTVRTAELSGAALDWAVAKAIGETNHIESRWYDDENGAAKIAAWCSRQFSTDWGLGGPLIERFNIWLSPPADDHDEPYGWDAEIYDDKGVVMAGESIGCKTPLIAAMRAILAAELGDTVDIPEELVK